MILTAQKVLESELPLNTISVEFENNTKGGSEMNTIAPKVLKELDELIVQLIKDIKEQPATEKIKALAELLSARANMDY
jgi:hypothetical protein